MKKIIYFLSFTLILSCIQNQDTNDTQPQGCSCESNLNWLIETFEENDAGFQFAIDQKGEKAYQEHNKSFFNKVKTIEKIEDCKSLLNEWTQFLRPGHLMISLSQSQNELSEKEVIEKFRDTEIFKITSKEFSAHLNKIEEPTFEGVWQSGIYKIGIIKDESSTEEKYIGFIIEGDGVYWKKNQVKLKIYKSERKYISDFYSKDHSIIRFENIDLLGSNFLSLGSVNLKRLESKFTINSEIENYFNSLSSNNASIKEHSKETMLLRIPSFAMTNKMQIDSILKVNHNEIVHHKNLIIDLRNNVGGSGGSDQIYQNIIPYVYTNPIKIVDVEFLSTPINNQRMESLIAHPSMPEASKEWARKGLEKLNNNPGKFVHLNDSIVTTLKLDDVYEYPKNVAILINGKNASTVEQFLIDVKQSKKVKLFGTSTMGAIDIAGLNTVLFPCEDLRLIYGLSRSLRMPNYAVDGRGVQPDYFIHESIPQHKWITYVGKILNQ